MDWAQDVEVRFERLGELHVPHLWTQAGAEDLGAWLIRVRTRLENDQSIDLNADRPATVRVIQPNADPRELFQSQANTCRYFNCDRAHTVIAIHKGIQEYKAKYHKLSDNLSGKFSSIEEVEGKALFSFVRKIEGAPTIAACLDRSHRFCHEVYD